MKYFAYGEKMFTPQLQDIVGRATCLGVAKILGYKLYFHSRSNEDYSGKCNIVQIKDHASEVYGVLYDIPPENSHLLDKAEGLGYGNQEITLKVYPVRNEIIRDSALSESHVYAFTYVAHKENVFEDLVPFAWYKEMVISGARAHHLPAEYIHQLEQYACTQDPNVQRANKQKRYLESPFL